MAKTHATPAVWTHIKDLKPDPVNSRKHGPRNIGMIADAMQEIGAARSIVIDEDGVVLAGNGALEAAAQVGITKLHVVDADGETLIAVRRRGLTPAQKVRLALKDNRSSELAEWEIDVLMQLQADGVELDMWSDAELAALLEAAETSEDEPELPAMCKCPTCGTSHKPKPRR